MSSLKVTDVISYKEVMTELVRAYQKMHDRGESLSNIRYSYFANKRLAFHMLKGERDDRFATTVETDGWGLVCYECCICLEFTYDSATFHGCSSDKCQCLMCSGCYKKMTADKKKCPNCRKSLTKGKKRKRIEGNGKEKRSERKGGGEAGG